MVYQSRLQCEGLVSLAFSQSGQSPDLVLPTSFFRAGGARTVAIVNDAASPLAAAAQWVFPLHAGAERRLAATKSFIAQLVAGARLVASSQDHAALGTALQGLPDALRRAAQQDWLDAIPPLTHATRLFVISRGLGLAIAHGDVIYSQSACG